MTRRNSSRGGEFVDLTAVFLEGRKLVRASFTEPTDPPGPGEGTQRVQANGLRQGVEMTVPPVVGGNSIVRAPALAPAMRVPPSRPTTQAPREASTNVARKNELVPPPRRTDLTPILLALTERIAERVSLQIAADLLALPIRSSAEADPEEC